MSNEASTAKPRQVQTNVKLMTDIIFSIQRKLISMNFCPQDIISEQRALSWNKHIHEAVRKKAKCLEIKLMDAPY